MELQIQGFHEILVLPFFMTQASVRTFLSKPPSSRNIIGNTTSQQFLQEMGVKTCEKNP